MEAGKHPTSNVALKQIEGIQTRREISILVLGETGAGKSSLIKRATGSPVKIGHSLKSCTAVCQGWQLTHGNEAITLIDSPGFDDTTRPDMEILASIVSCLQDRRHPPLVGIIYMHRITDKKLTGASRMNLDMLRALCGEHYFQNVLLVTSMWDTIPTSRPLIEYESREAELRSAEFWGDLIDKGATMMRYNGERGSGIDIVDVLCKKHQAPALGIVLELQRGVELENTTAGRVLTAELRRREEKRRREQEEDEEEERLLQAQVAETQAQLKRVERRNMAEAEHGHHRRQEGNRDRDRNLAWHGAQASWLPGFHKKRK
ncbi:P-loop containing nucleoside triphosphate hydrolase protein [Acephala macrosclerotiorum]|nr:P-loop containing nucleoside triphosphate hydrolase protein [Acephala macrosclerotiorum]